MSFLNDPLAGLRRQAQQLIGANAVALNSRPHGDPDPSGRDLADSGGKAMTAVPEGVIKTAKTRGVLTEGGKVGGKAVQGLAEAHLHAPGYLADGVEVLTSDDKGRAAAGIAGSRMGAWAGAAVPGAEWATVPLGAFAGNLAGHYLYDHRQQIGDAFGKAGRSLKQDLPRYAPLNLLPGNPYGL